MRPCFRSAINSIQLFALCKVVLIKKYGMDKILLPFIEDVRHLESVSVSHKFLFEVIYILLHYAMIPEG